ncbi:hypothetical protein [Streptomyces marianii]|uniref:Uncharacterized protein n=1 Tax=Streptomyces marianii TaxID=1817406 RepID=A0A5R9DQH4_9ACTN|nr:hypothetical protein [Streptomyces marianii]TLQ38628.1 hypothetical protein FEF34_40845 [Streptomyces marianii]
MPEKDDPCDLLKGTPSYDYCQSDGHEGIDPDAPGGGVDGGFGMTDKAADNVQDLAEWLIKKIKSLIAPKDAWAPDEATDAVFAPFLWLGQNLAVAIFTCVVAVCALTAWQGAPRLRQLGHSTGWTLVAVAGMASVPGVVAMLNTAVSQGFTAAFSLNESTLFGALTEDLKEGAEEGNVLGVLIVTAALVVALGFAALVFMVRNLGILAFVCFSPLVIASLARGGDMSAVQAWAQKLLGLMFAPFALLLVAPFVPLVEDSLVMHGVLLVAADVLMWRMIFHGVPYFGPRLARAARSAVETRVSNPVVRAAVRAGVPDFYEQENTPRGPRTVATPGRALAQDGDVLAAAYGIRTRKRPGRMTTESAIAQINRDGERQAKVMAARRDARAAHTPTRTPPPRSPSAGSNPSPQASTRSTPQAPARSTPPAPRSGPASGSGPSSGGPTTR